MWTVDEITILKNDDDRKLISYEKPINIIIDASDVDLLWCLYSALISLNGM